MRQVVLALTLCVALAACGRRVPLAPAAGEEAPPVAAMASRPPTTEELLTPTTEARPERVDELLRRSQPREDDRFDLPPQD